MQGKKKHSEKIIKEIIVTITTSHFLARSSQY